MANQEKIKENFLGNLRNKIGEVVAANNDNKPKEPEQGEIYNKILSGTLTRDDPLNSEYINNIQILVDPVYIPDNFLFVKQFNCEMDKLMN